MLVGQEGGLTSSCVLENTCDPAAILCAFLMAKRGWSRSRIALTLGVPPLVVEECIRSGVSSAALRKQMAHWVTEYREEALPPLLVRAVLNAVPKTRATTTIDREEDDEAFAALDPVTRSLFLELSSSVGQSFMSILKDPREGRGNNNNNSWGSWLGNVVFGASDGGTGNIGPSSSSSESLLARYNLQEDYSSYLHLVSAPYNVNREEGRLFTSIASTNTQISDTDGSPLVTENFPWPSDVPDEFFKSSYDPQNELWLLEQKIEERMKGREDKEKVDDSGDSETFTYDFEVIESRMKELRKWENAVEHCLLYHVQSRSEEFFSTSHELGDRAAEAERTLKDLQQTRADIGVFGKGLVREMMLIAKLYRVRNNLRSLRDLAEVATSVSSQVAAVENWVALPERDMMELPFVVENYCAIQDAITPENDIENNNRKKTSTEEVLMMKLTALRDLPQRVMQVKEKLCVMIMEEMEAALIPNIRNGVDDGCVARAFLSAVDMGIWPTAVKHCREQLLEALWMTVRETFIAFIMSNCTLSDHTADTLLSTAVTARSLREEKLVLLNHCNSCRFPVYMQLLSNIMDHILEFVNEAAQRWGFLLLESTPNPNKSNNNNNNNENSSLPTTEDTKKYLSMLCVGAEGIVAMLLEVRSQQEKVPTNVRELEALVSVGCDFLPNMINELQRVLSVSGNISDSRIFISGKQLKSALTRLTKEHFRSHHMETIEKLRVTIENETWQRESVDVAFQSCVDALCRSDDMAIKELQARAIFTDVTSVSRQKPLLLSSTSTTTTTTMPQETDIVNTEEILENHSTGVKNMLLLLPPIGEHLEGRVVSGSLLLLIEMLRDYDDYLGRFPFLAFDVMGKMYDLLRLYDSHCAALLLGAMAVENGVLQTITMQHMAIASQNLGFLYDAIPLMQKRWLKATSSDRLPPSICDDMARVRKDCWTFRCELLGKISALVREKVDGLGTVSAAQWQPSGNEWVMTMLREVARLMRALKPLMPAEDCRGVVVPLLGTFARMIRAVTLSPIVDADLRAIMESDVIVFKTNVEKFGFDVLRCAALYASITEAMEAPVEPCSSEESVVAWFFSRDESS
ncbi:Vacuolar protein sorting-associated protein 54 [Trypanosoma melophagium]|uniref:Vacuolar protein sorting-associated protein 54 n=1 Tax=Trypanosoma melophagium TaxID=715481 RepID=UPI00351A4D41|nr:Vacuolar protein sorting-associated protein 54 [Trypanosoma melophagium]